MDKPNQTQQPTKIISNEQILALAWNIATEPKLYRELAHNPYTRAAQEIISKRFPDANAIDIIRAVILAEPEGKYDRDFKQLPRDQQEKVTTRQKETATKIHKQFIWYCKKHKKEFNRQSKAFVYDSLSFFIFKSIDIKEIELHCSQTIRRNFRLAIINFIEKHHGPSAKAYYSKLPPKLALLMVLFAVPTLLLFFYFVYTKPHAPDTTKQFLTSGVQKENQRLPVRLTIPKINVDARVEYVGITSGGAMDIPSNTSDVGWYQLGPSPGEIGNAVISGHFDGRIGESGVFNKLNKLKQGDKIYVINDRGTVITFIVRTTRTYNPGYAEEVFFPYDNGIHLNLITCDGVWNKSKKSYSKRLVVFADIMQ